MYAMAADLCHDHLASEEALQLYQKIHPAQPEDEKIIDRSARADHPKKIGGGGLNLNGRHDAARSALWRPSIAR